jgi:hypothetical protein
MRRRLEAIGYWFNDQAPSAYPRPQRLVGRWREDRRAAVIAYLRAGATFETYRATSLCRFGCGISSRALGARDLSDGVWVWPEGLAHYVEVHAVQLPTRFVRHAIAHGLPPQQLVWGRREGLIDERRWLAWGRRRGAVLALTGWRIPDAALRATLEARVANQARRPSRRLLQQPASGGAIVLYRARTDDVVLGLPTGELAIVRLDASGARRILVGWDAWPHVGGRLAGRSRRSR